MGDTGRLKPWTGMTQPAEGVWKLPFMVGFREQTGGGDDGFH